jgi:guanylate kinase
VRPFLLVLSSPSGGGKSTIASHLLEARDDLGYSVSATTRAPRAGEEQGVHYHFLSADEFAGREAAGEFLETASYGGCRYGTLRAEVERVMAGGRHVILDIEVAGSKQVRERFPESVHVFVLPPSATTLVDRLKARRTETAPELAARLETAGDELVAAMDYDYIVVNDDLVTAVDQVAAILDAERSRVRRLANLDEVVNRMRRDVQAHAQKLGTGRQDGK